MLFTVLGVIVVLLCSFVLSSFGKMAGEYYRQMTVTMLRAGDKIMQELVFSNFYSAVSNFLSQVQVMVWGTVCSVSCLVVFISSSR